MVSEADLSCLLADLVRERLPLILEAESWTMGGSREGGSLAPSAEEQAAARRRWRSAVAAQAALAHQDEAAAGRAVISMLNQMIRLARDAPWWESRAAEVIAETVRYATGNLAVGSAPAQRVWDKYWSAHSSLGKFGPEMGLLEQEELQALTSQMAEDETAWRAAWDRWHAERGLPTEPQLPALLAFWPGPGVMRRGES